jgi:small subunit ribosomal protein S8
MVDPISDMLTQIRNAQAIGHTTVDLPFSKIKFSLAEILAKEGLIKKISKKGRGIKRKLEIELLYEDKKNAIPKINQLKRISKPGKREYIKAKDIHPVLAGRGINIISTSKGLMTGKEARKKELGGEILCEIW